jgi:predicted nuclease with TOPRIM domain
MHLELERMSEQNTKLSEELNNLQISVIDLNKQLRIITLENQRLHEEVTNLTGEVTRLQALLKDENVSTSQD